jgi:hypothetical protein
LPGVFLEWVKGYGSVEVCQWWFRRMVVGLVEDSAGSEK